jgi:hypothetical protein
MGKADALLAALILPVSTLAAGAHAATADAAFVGHYYLSGVMETGSSCCCGLMARLRGTYPMARWIRARAPGFAMAMPWC